MQPVPRRGGAVSRFRGHRPAADRCRSIVARPVRPGWIGGRRRKDAPPRGERCAQKKAPGKAVSQGGGGQPTLPGAIGRAQAAVKRRPICCTLLNNSVAMIHRDAAGHGRQTTLISGKDTGITVGAGGSRGCAEAAERQCSGSSRSSLSTPCIRSEPVASMLGRSLRGPQRLVALSPVRTHPRGSLIGSDSIPCRRCTAAIEQGRTCRKRRAVAAEKPRANGSLGLSGPRDCSPA